MLYIGVRVEIFNRISNIKEIADKYNKTNVQSKIFDVNDNGRVIIDRANNMLIAKGKQEKHSTGSINFSIMAEIKSNNSKDLERLIKIVNILGNDRLIRERVKTFVSGTSALNKIPEFKELLIAFNNINKLVPGFIEMAWYYAPEAKFE